jgi:hypothetical protein
LTLRAEALLIKPHESKQLLLLPTPCNAKMCSLAAPSLVKPSQPLQMWSKSTRKKKQKKEMPQYNQVKGQDLMC